MAIFAQKSHVVMENESRQDMQWVASKIYKKFHLSKKGNFIVYEIDDFDKDKLAPSYSNQLHGVLYKMEKSGAIKIHKKEFRQYLPKTEDESKVNFFTIEILQPRFDEFHKKYNVEIQDSKKVSGNAVPEISAGNLSAYSDGTIRYGGKVIKMRKQPKPPAIKKQLPPEVNKLFFLSLSYF